MDKQILQKIAEELPYGSINKIAKHAKVSRVTVRNFFKGETRNTNVNAAVTTAIVDVYKEHLHQKAENEKSLEALLTI